MHVDVFQADGSITHTGYGVVEEWVSLLQGFEILRREGIAHFDNLWSRIGRRQLPRSERWGFGSYHFMPFFIGCVDCAVSLTDVRLRSDSSLLLVVGRLFNVVKQIVSCSLCLCLCARVRMK